ncbi:MAG: prolyl aminopeptidase [Gammaproteobacteria bacterium]|nr:prolyl aminopeptidase [Gammaproteobacteria bacterium]MDH5213006.1 prolyl aminopeptidase [Gammaproteobacteria bacterium]MDH5500282.1 prolyl aminopeptidase [Gammaproteobacteria bacterium]
MRSMNEYASRRTLYPPIEANRSGTLDVGDGHQLYYEECGNPHGKPVVFLHGGPGGGCNANMRRFFNPDVYRIVLFDQRGCGRSKPHAGLEHNTTWHLVDDIEVLRSALQIDRWQVFGGSWGSTLALAYAETHPEKVSELVLRGIFLMQQQEMDWMYRFGTSELFPDHWNDFIKPIPKAERSDLLRAYHKRVTSDDPVLRLQAAKAWSAFEGSTITLLPDAAVASSFVADDVALAMARIETHYFVNRGFMQEGQLLRDIGKVRKIPAVIVHGRYDVLCPASTAWALSRAWPEAKLRIVPDAGHSAFEPGNIHELVMATDSFSTYQVHHH